MPPASCPARSSYPILSACHATSAGSWPPASTKPSGTPAGASQPSQVANWSRSGMQTAPGMCPAAKSATGRTSIIQPPRPGRERTAAGVSGARPGIPVTGAGPERLTSARRSKYAG